MTVVRIARAFTYMCSLPPWRNGLGDCGHDALARGRPRRCLPVAVAAVVLATALLPSTAVAQDDGAYPDVPADAYYTVPVQTLGSAGVFDGTLCDDGFCPNEPIDRKTMAVWTVRVVDGQDPPAISRSRFNDVDAAGFHARFIERMAELEVTSGCGDGSGFCPDRTVTRAEMAVFLSKTFNLPAGPDPNFSDVPDQAWYATYVGRLTASGITVGCGDGTVFCPDRATTRAQMAAFLHRGRNRAELEGSITTHGFPIPEKEALQSPQLGTSLDDLVSRLEAGEITEEVAAREAPVSRGKSVAVTIYLSGSADGVVRFLADNANIAPRHVGEDYVEAFVPVGLLRQIPEMSGVLYVETIVPPELPQMPSQKTIPGNGPGVHGSDVWNEAGFTGDGIKVGVIDTGFDGFSELMGTELPEMVIARCFGTETDEAQGLVSCEGNSSHGTKVAESIIDMAPDAFLYIGRPMSKGDLVDIVDWMTGKGVSVINMSLSWTFDGPGDGTSPRSTSPLNAVDTAVENGVVWVNSAGNYARRAWFGAPTDSDGDKTLEFEGSEQLTVSGGTWVELRWNDKWGGASLDLDLYLYDSDGKVLKRSVNPQTGKSWHNPYEQLWLGGSAVTTLQVVSRSGSLPRWIQIRQRGGGGTIDDATGTGSIVNPAESTNPGMLAVGAARWNRPETIESFSSRGPTPDGRTKPDLVGADCGATNTSPSFCGTSQASPHVAGMAALVRQRFPDITPQRVVAYLKENAIDRGVPGADNTWGHGFAVLPPLLRDAPVSERDALVALYNATDGANWDNNINWLSDRPLDEWYGVTTDDDGRVTVLELVANELSGEIPIELGNLASLERLNLSNEGSASNRLSGEIPSELGNLSELTWLGLGGNQFRGEIPAELGNLSKLTVLRLDNNRLSGDIPSELGKLGELEILYFYQNRLSGEIPAELGNLTKLTLLHLASNQLGGEIPSELGKLTNLDTLALTSNRLSGEIPIELGELPGLENLWLGYNSGLSGPLPGSFTGLNHLNSLQLENTELCVPTDDTFQAWLQRIPRKIGVENCEVDPLGSPPRSLGLDPFYEKYRDAGGIPIVSAPDVPDEALYRARDIIGEMLSDRADLAASMARDGIRVVVLGKSASHSELPEWVEWIGDPGEDELRGFFLDPLVVTSEENLLCYPDDPHRDGGEVLIHELAHAVHFVGIEKRQPDARFGSRLDTMFTEARAAGLWDYTYAATDSVEYWAEGVEIWFGINEQGNGVNTRGELEDYDPSLAGLVTEVFGDATVSSSCNGTSSDDRRRTLIQGVLSGPDGRALPGVLLWAWSGVLEDSSPALTDPDGVFGMWVPDGSFTLYVYAAPGARCAGWYDGDGGVTTIREQAERLTTSGTAIKNIAIQLPAPPEDLPSIQC